MKKALRIVFWLIGTILLLAVIGLAVVPAVRIVLLGRRADAVRGQLFDRIGAGIRPGAPLPGARPPVAEADDPIAALDAADLARERDSFRSLRNAVALVEPKPRPADRPVRRHPLTDDEAAALDAWFSAHLLFPAAAEAFTRPAYRSCLPGVATPADFAPCGECGCNNMWLDPRSRDVLDYVPALALRARLAFHRGDATAALADLARIQSVVPRLLREPTLIGGLVARGVSAMPLTFGVIQSRLDLWPDDALETVPREAEAIAWFFETRWPDTLAGEILWTEAQGMGDFLSGKIAPWDPATWTDNPDFPGAKHTPFPLRLWAVCGWRNVQIDYLRYCTDLADHLTALASTPPGPERASLAHYIANDLKNAFRDDAMYGERNLLACIYAPPHEFLLKLVQGPRTDATVIRAATAVERYRRANGALPPDLAALVPGYLPSLPLDPTTGDPIPYAPGPVALPEEPVHPIPGDPDAEPDTSFGAPSDEAPPRILPAATLPGFTLGRYFFPVPEHPSTIP